MKDGTPGGIKWPKWSGWVTWQSPLVDERHPLSTNVADLVSLNRLKSTEIVQDQINLQEGSRESRCCSRTPVRMASNH